MTSSAATFVSTASLASRTNKGSFSNRLEHTKKQFNNALKTTAKDRFITVAGAVATGVAGTAVHHS